VFEQLSQTEKRRVLLASRIRFGVETKIPRERAIDKMIENALSVAAEDEWFTAQDILGTFRDIGGIPTLRLLQIDNGLARLLTIDRIKAKIQKPFNGYRLTPDVAEETQADFTEASRRLERVLKALYRDVLDDHPPEWLAPFFLEFVCEIFRSLGTQWASYLGGDALPSLMDMEEVERVAEAKILKCGLPTHLHDSIKRESLGFFQQANPDFDYLKFALGQSFYIAQLLGIEGKDYLSEEIFSEGNLYLDSSVVIPAVLIASPRHQIFQELCKVCRRLRIRMLVTRPTVDEVRSVAADQERIAERVYADVYERVPAGITSKVRGDFFEAYSSLRKAGTLTSIGELFRPFDQLADTLRTMFGIEVVDDDRFEKAAESPDYDRVKQVHKDCSWRVRKREKFANALAHDAKLFLFLRSECESPEIKIWFLTRDASLPVAWRELHGRGPLVRCFMLDGLLQSISPFVVADEDVKDFSAAFSQVVANQLLPQGKLFDIEDFQLFQELDLDCKALAEEELEAGLLSVKQHVLKGASYRHENLEEAAYELRRFFARRGARVANLGKQLEKMEKKLEERERAHANHVQQLTREHEAKLAQVEAGHSVKLAAVQSQVDKLESEREKQEHKRARRRLLVKQVLAVLLIGVVMVGVTWVGSRWEQVLRRVVWLMPIYGAALVLVLCLIKLLLFRNDRLADVFRSWIEVKDLFW
jgi:hypothetical protein